MEFKTPSLSQNSQENILKRKIESIENSTKVQSQLL